MRYDLQYVSVSRFNFCFYRICPFQMDHMVKIKHCTVTHGHTKVDILSYIDRGHLKKGGAKEHKRDQTRGNEES